MGALRETVETLGEDAVLLRVTRLLRSGDFALLGPGDDAAVVSASDERFVVTTDLMVHGPDFRFAWSTPYDLGWKAAATNLSDIAAMGARPTALTVALAVPSDTEVVVLERFAEGLRDCLDFLAPGAGVVGGDLSASSTFTIAVTAFGDLEGRPAVLRSGARVDDIIAYAGSLGHAAQGLALLFAEGCDSLGQPSRERGDIVRAAHPVFVNAQLAPRPPVQAGVAAALAGATAMLDVSDGLARDARRIADASGVTLNFEAALLGDSVPLALAGAEDHGLLATFPAGTVLPEPFRVIGTIVARADAVTAITVDGDAIDVSGWDPYTGWNGGSG